MRFLATLPLLISVSFSLRRGKDHGALHRLSALLRLGLHQMDNSHRRRLAGNRMVKEVNSALRLEMVRDNLDHRLRMDRVVKGSLDHHRKMAVVLEEAEIAVHCVVQMTLTQPICQNV